jgi:hypothetical protein
MADHFSRITLAALSAAVIGLGTPIKSIAQDAQLSVGLSCAQLATPVKSIAQDDNSGSKQADDPSLKKIDLDLESSNLYYGLKLLFSQVKANFTIDESLKSLTVTAHLTQVPFRTALETLLKSTSTPLTYKVENGIYSVVPKIEAVAEVQIDNQIDGPAVDPGRGWKFGVIRPNNLAAADIVQAFGGHVVTVGYTPTFGQGGLGGGNGQSGGFGGGGSLGGIGGAGNGFNSGAYGNTGSRFGNSGLQFGNSGQTGSTIGGSNSGLNGLRGH